MAGRNALETLNVCPSPPLKDAIYPAMPECPPVASVRRPQDLKRKRSRFLLTFKWRKATVEDQLKIAKLTLSQDERSERLGLSCELIVTRSIAGEQVLEDTTVGRIRHFVWI